MKRSKLLTGLALYFVAITILNLFGISRSFDRDWLYLVQAFIATGFALTLAIGLFLEARWTIPVFVAGALLLIILNWFWLRSNPPEGMYWGTKWLIAIILNLFPGALLLLRRDRFRSTIADELNGKANA